MWAALPVALILASAEAPSIFDGPVSRSTGFTGFFLSLSLSLSLWVLNVPRFHVGKSVGSISSHGYLCVQSTHTCKGGLCVCPCVCVCVCVCRRGKGSGVQEGG